MRGKNTFRFIAVLACGSVLCGAAAAQLRPQEPDPLAQMRAKAAAESQVCSIDEPSACAAATPKIVASAQGPSPLSENVKKFEEAGRENRTAAALAAFRGSGLTDVREEQGNVVAEIRGRSKPDDFVVLAAPLGAVADGACNDALVVEAARDIQLTGLRPVRSIRFVLFSDAPAYVRAHRGELDRAIAVAIFDQGCGEVSGFSLGGRHDVEAGVRESFSVAPIDTWGIEHHTFDAPLRDGAIDFLLEGVPSLIANRAASSAATRTALNILQRNSAIAGVLAFALAEHAAPLGRRFSRAEIAALLKDTGLEAQMRAANLWGEWENGQRGRQR